MSKHYGFSSAALGSNQPFAARCTSDRCADLASIHVSTVFSSSNWRAYRRPIVALDHQQKPQQISASLLTVTECRLRPAPASSRVQGWLAHTVQHSGYGGKIQDHMNAAIRDYREFRSAIYVGLAGCDPPNQRDGWQQEMVPHHQGMLRRLCWYAWPLHS